MGRGVVRRAFGDVCSVACSAAWFPVQQKKRRLPVGSDLNGDTIPDFGLCSLNGAAVAGPQALLMQIVASKLQYLGSEQGLFFDPGSRDAEPLVDNEGFREALVLTRRLWMASLDSEPGGWQYLHETAWLEGRCAAYIWLSGSVALVTTKRDLGRYDVNGTVLWRPEYGDGTYRPPRRVFPPGSERVYVRNEGMRACTAELSHDEEKEVYCPHLCGNQISGVPRGVAIPRHRRDVVPVTASARWRGGSRRSTQSEPNSLVDFHTGPHLNAARDERDGRWVNRVPSAT